MFPSDNRKNEMFVERSIHRTIHIHIILVIIITLCTHSVYGKTRGASSRKKSSSPISIQHQRLLQNEMKKYLGTPYELGGTGLDGIDCSGFARRIYKDVYGVNLPHNAASQSKCPPSVLKKVPLENLNPGDLIFFSSSPRNKQRITHVGLYLSDGEFIHASRGKKSVVISSLNEGHWRSKIVSTKRLSRLDPWDEWQAERSSNISLAVNKKNRLRLSYKKTAKPSPTAEPNKYAAIYYRDQFHDLDLQYTRILWDNTWNVTMSMFQQQALIGEGRMFSNPYPVPAGQLGCDGHFTSAYNRGFRMSSDFRPVNWLNIMPSITYFNHGSAIQNRELPRRAMGVDIDLISQDSTWSLSTGVQYSDLKQPSISVVNYHKNDINELDMSLRYRQQVNDRLNITVIGQRIQQSSSGIEQYLDNERTDQSISFRLNFVY